MDHQRAALKGASKEPLRPQIEDITPSSARGGGGEGGGGGSSSSYRGASSSSNRGGSSSSSRGGGGGGGGGGGARARMEELKELLSAGLVSQEEYDDKRQEILNGL